MVHQSYASPAFDNMCFFSDRNTKEESSSRSPTTVFAVAELNNVFRVPDNVIECSVDSQEKENTGSTNGRLCQPFAPSLICSFATDSELSTFSEDTEEGDEAETQDLSSDIHRSRFIVQRRRRSSRSIFRPILNGNKRRCDSTDEDHEEHDYSTPAKKRRISAPSIGRANPIGGSDDDDGCDNDLTSMRSSSNSFASPLKRVYRGDSCSSNSSYISPGGTSSFTSLFASDAAVISNTQALEAMVDERCVNTLLVMPRQLTHPLSFQAIHILNASYSDNTDEKECCKEI